MEKLNSAQSIEKPLLRLDNMQVGMPYMVIGVREVSTRFGKKILLELEEHVMFLPDRYTELFTGEMLNFFDMAMEKEQQFLFVVEKLQNRNLKFVDKITL